jgi:hypothetical protein
MTICPVCGYGLSFSPWEGNSPSDEICPCCFIQFGYDDFAGGNLIDRAKVYEDWRRLWVDTGMKWNSKGTKPPNDWNPAEQLRQVTDTSHLEPHLEPRTLNLEPLHRR